MGKALKITGKIALYILGAAVTAAIAAIISAWLTGQSLVGLNGLRELGGVVARGTVPTWLFALVFVFAVFALQYAVKYSPARKSKGRVHFIPDVHNTGWAKQHDSEMNANIGGTFTYDGPGGLTVLKAFLKGSETTNFDMTLLEPDRSDKGAGFPQFTLPQGKPVHAILYLRLRPVLGTPGQPLRRNVFFRDNFNRDFSIGPVDLPYVGSR